MPPTDAAGRRPSRRLPPHHDEHAPRSALRRLHGWGAKAWRSAWSLLPGSGGAMRLRLAVLARRLLGEPPLRGVTPYDPAAVAKWMRRHAPPGDAVAAHIAAMPAPPRLLLLVDARGAAPDRLEATLASLRAQDYPHWQALLLGAEAEAGDPRVRPVRDVTEPDWARPEADWIMPLAAGDRLTGTALYHLAAAAAPGLDILYGDEIRPQPPRPGAHPWLKPDFDIDRLLGADLFGHAVAYRPALLGGQPPPTGAERRYATGLRAALAAGRHRIGHVPALLCAWEREAEPADDATLARLTADILREHGLAAEVEPVGPGLRRIRWPLPAEPPLVSVIVPTRDRAALVAACAEGVLHGTDYPSLEFLLVDNGSTEPEALALFERLAADPRVRVLPAPGPFNYSRLNNLAAAAARGEILLLLNNDIEVIDGGWLRELVSQVLRPDVGAVGARLLYADGSLQHGGVVTGIGGVADHYGLGVARDDPGYVGSLVTVREVAAATAACLAVRREAFLAVGGLDEANLAVAFNDIDLCVRIREAGWRILWTPFAELYHLESASRGQDLAPEKLRRFAGELAYMKRRWGDVLMRDPFYNPNLELDSVCDRLADAPRATPPWAAAARR